MAGGRDAILRALEELSEAELRRLKAELNRGPVGRGFQPIPRGRLAGADALDVTDLLVGHYREGYGGRVAAQALRRIQRRDLAHGLDPSGSPDPDDLTDDLSAEVTARSPAASFVQRHRVALIQRVRRVAAILDLLEAEGVLTTEEVATVAAGPTPQDQMRRLLATAPAWGGRGHGHFLRAMRRVHPYLMEELEGGEDPGAE